MDHVTGDKARKLLEGTTEGPWEIETYHVGGPFDAHGDVVTDIGPLHSLWMNTSPESCIGGSDEDQRLAAAAPALAETIAWLYGQTGHDDHGEWGLEQHHNYDYKYASVDSDGEGKVELSTGPYGQAIHLYPDEAVEVARALLTAAEKVRNV